MSCSAAKGVDKQRLATPSRRGWEQFRHLAEVLGGGGVSAILSSPRSNEPHKMVLETEADTNYLEANRKSGVAHE